MKLIPAEFEKIKSRVIEINTSLDSHGKLVNLNYQKDIWNFKIIASSQEYSEMAKATLVIVGEILTEIEKKRIEIFENLPTEFVDIGDTDQYGNITSFFVEGKEATTLRPFNVIDSDYLNKQYQVISQEISAYRKLVEDTLGIILRRYNFITDIETAKAISIFEFAENKFFIAKDDRSQNDFVALLTNIRLTNEDLKQLRITLGCGNQEAAYIFLRLKEKEILMLDKETIRDIGCFIRSTGTRYQILPEYLSKLKTKKEKLGKLPIQNEIDTAIDELSKRLRLLRGHN